MAITSEQIEQAYKYSKDVFEERIEKNQAINDLHILHHLNMGTARDFINQYEWMLRGQGEKFKRTMSFASFKYYLNHIGSDNGLDALKVAIGTVKQNIEYYETSHSRMVGVRQLIESIEQGLGEPLSIFVTEAQYQKAVREQAETKYKEPLGHQPPPPKINNGVIASYQRNPVVAKEALRKVDFTCEISPLHSTFKTTKNLSYVEAHHLVPICKQGDFAASLDVLANIVSLCPSCHKLLHHGRPEDKKDYLSKLYSERTEMLNEKGISVNEKKLFGYYNQDILEEDA